MSVKLKDPLRSVTHPSRLSRYKTVKLAHSWCVFFMRFQGKVLIPWFQSVGLTGVVMFQGFYVIPTSLFIFPRLWSDCVAGCAHLVFGYAAANARSYIIRYIRTTRVLEPCERTYSHTWWWTEWPDFPYPRGHLCRWRSAVHQAPVPPLLQPVMESILPLDVLSIGSESEKVLRFNLSLSFSFHFYLVTHPSLHPYTLSSFLSFLLRD